MHQFIFKTLSNSTKSLTSCRNIYRRFMRNGSNKPSKSSKLNAPILLQINATKDLSKQISNLDGHNKIKMSACTSKKNTKRPQSSSGRLQYSILSNSTKKKFYSSNLDLHPSKNYYSKISETGVKYFNDGEKQQNKIKNTYKQQMVDKTTLLSVKDENNITPQPKAIKLKKWQCQERKKRRNLWSGDDHLTKLVLQKETITGKKKIKLVYPKHVINYKTGFDKRFKVNKRYTSFAQEKVRNSGVPIAFESPKKVSTAPKVEFRPPPFILKNNNISSRCKNENSQRLEKYSNYSRSITAHPLLTKANYQNKMSIKKKYNFLLLNRNKMKPVTGKQKNENKSLEREHLCFRKTEGNQVNCNNSEHCIVQHPLMNIQENNYDRTLKYPKTVISEKNETFEVDDICWQTKDKYYLLNEPTIAKYRINSKINDNNNLIENKNLKRTQSHQINIASKQQIQNNTERTNEKAEVTQDKLPVRNIKTAPLKYSAENHSHYSNNTPKWKKNRSDLDTRKTIDSKLKRNIENHLDTNMNKQITESSKQIASQQDILATHIQNDDKVKHIMIKQEIKQCNNERNVQERSPVTIPIQKINHLQRILNQYKMKGNIKIENDTKNDINICRIQKANNTLKMNNVPNTSTGGHTVERQENETLQTVAKLFDDHIKPKKNLNNTTKITEDNGRKKWKKIKEQLKKVSLLREIQRTENIALNAKNSSVQDGRSLQTMKDDGIENYVVATKSQALIDQSYQSKKTWFHWNNEAEYQEINDKEVQRKLKRIREILDNKTKDQSMQNSIDYTFHKTHLTLNLCKMQPEKLPLFQTDTVDIQLKDDKEKTIDPINRILLPFLHPNKDQTYDFMESKRDKLSHPIRNDDNCKICTTAETQTNDERNNALQKAPQKCSKSLKIYEENSSNDSKKASSNEEIGENDVEQSFDTLSVCDTPSNGFNENRREMISTLPNKKIVSFHKPIPETISKDNSSGLTFFGATGANVLNECDWQKCKKTNEYIINQFKKLSVNYKTNISNEFPNHESYYQLDSKDPDLNFSNKSVDVKNKDDLYNKYSKPVLKQNIEVLDGNKVENCQSKNFEVFDESFNKTNGFQLNEIANQNIARKNYLFSQTGSKQFEKVRKYPFNMKKRFEVEGETDKNANEEVKMLNKKSFFSISNSYIKENRSFIKILEDDQASKSDTSISNKRVLNYPSEVCTNKSTQNLAEFIGKQEKTGESFSNLGAKNCEVTKLKNVASELGKVQEPQIRQGNTRSIPANGLRMEFIKPFQQNLISENILELGNKNKILNFDCPKPSYSTDLH